MDAPELRMGNLVLNGKAIRAVDYLDIRDLAEGRLYKPFEPIPITEEWLLKAGFHKRDPSFENILNSYWVKNAVCLFFTETPPNDVWLGGYGFSFDGKYYASTFQWNIRYIHQLQNLYFALTGTELLR